MPSLDTTHIAVASRQHRRLLTELSPGHYELCIDNTTLEKMLTCPRSFEHYAVYGRDTLKRDALNYGSALHHALEVFYRADDQSDPSVLLTMQDRIMQHFAENPCSADAWRNADHALEAVRRYFNWRQQCPVWTPIEWDEPGIKLTNNGFVNTTIKRKMVEVPFKLELCKFNYPDANADLSIDWTLFPYPTDLITVSRPAIMHPVSSITVYWTGKIDLVTKVQTNEIRPVDHKTTSIEGSNFYTSFILSSQMRGYHWATQKLLGHQIPGVIVDALIGRPPSKSGTSYENKVFPINYTQEQIDSWERDTKDHVNTLLERLFRGYFPENNTWCTSTAREANNQEFGAKYNTCPYHDVCTMSRAAQPLILMSGQYAERTWDPLKVS